MNNPLSFTDPTGFVCTAGQEAKSCLIEGPPPPSDGVPIDDGRNSSNTDGSGLNNTVGGGITAGTVAPSNPNGSTAAAPGPSDGDTSGGLTLPSSSSDSDEQTARALAAANAQAEQDRQTADLQSDIFHANARDNNRVIVVPAPPSNGFESFARDVTGFLNWLTPPAASIQAPKYSSGARRDSLQIPIGCDFAAASCALGSGPGGDSGGGS